METWLPVTGYEDLYKISDLGQVWSEPKNGKAGRMLRPIPAKNGYLRVNLWRDGKSRMHLVHQLVMVAFVGPPSPGEEVRHWDNDPTNNALSNLIYGTKAENEQDKLRHGTNYQLNKTHCSSGHLYDTANTYNHPQGFRVCRECQRAADRKYRQAKSGHNK